MKDKTEVEFQAEWEKMGVPANETVLVAVSTGCDSMTLLSLLQRLPEKMRPTVQVAYVDHQLREQSKKETDFITKGKRVSPEKRHRGISKRIQISLL